MPQLSDYFVNAAGELECGCCGGLGNAVTSPFVDEKLGYIPAHGHKAGCAFAARELIIAEKDEARAEGGKWKHVRPIWQEQTRDMGKAGCLSHETCRHSWCCTRTEPLDA